MDKINNFDTVKYMYDNNIIDVERHFTGTIHITEILKKYIDEQQGEFVLSNSTEKCNSGCGNTTVVTFREGGTNENTTADL